MYRSKQQKGAVLVVALVFLLLTAMISSTLMQTSVLETKMSGNEQLREEAFQQVHAVANALLVDPSNIMVAGDVGFKICPAGVSGCNSNILSLPDAVTTVHDGVDLKYHIERLAPLEASMPYRKSEDDVDSGSFYKAALFEVRASYDGAAVGLSRAEIAQGVAVRIAKSGQ